MIISKTIIEQDSENACEFFMRQSSFCNIGLPRYFDFQRLLDALKDALEMQRIWL